MPVLSSTKRSLPDVILLKVWDFVPIFVHNLHADLDVPVHQAHQLKVVVVVSERVVEGGGNIEPSKVEKELEGEEDPEGESLS